MLVVATKIRLRFSKRTLASLFYNFSCLFCAPTYLSILPPVPQSMNLLGNTVAVSPCSLSTSALFISDYSCCDLLLFANS